MRGLRLLWDTSLTVLLILGCVRKQAGPEAMRSNPNKQHSPRPLIQCLPLSSILTSFPGRVSVIKMKRVLCSCTCFCHDVRHSNSKQTKTNIDNREWAIALIDLTMLLLENCEGFWNLGLKKPCMSRAYWALVGTLKTIPRVIGNGEGLACAVSEGSLRVLQRLYQGHKRPAWLKWNLCFRGITDAG